MKILFGATINNPCEVKPSSDELFLPINFCTRHYGWQKYFLEKKGNQISEEGLFVAVDPFLPKRSINIFYIGDGIRKWRDIPFILDFDAIKRWIKKYHYPAIDNAAKNVLISLSGKEIGEWEFHYLKEKIYREVFYHTGFKKNLYYKDYVETTLSVRKKEFDIKEIH